LIGLRSCVHTRHSFGLPTRFGFVLGTAIFFPSLVFGPDSLPFFRVVTQALSPFRFFFILSGYEPVLALSFDRQALSSGPPSSFFFLSLVFGQLTSLFGCYEIAISLPVFFSLFRITNLGFVFRPPDFILGNRHPLSKPCLEQLAFSG
jgi:hypothetical protein